jgi:hypothetical protein
VLSLGAKVTFEGRGVFGVCLRDMGYIWGIFAKRRGILGALEGVF